MIVYRVWSKAVNAPVKVAKFSVVAEYTALGAQSLTTAVEGLMKLKASIG